MIDTHAHLNFPEFAKDLDEILGAARSTGIKRIVNIGVDLKSSHASVKLAREHDEIFAAIGFHPHDAKLYSDDAEAELKELANNSGVVAIGEIGLDFYRDHSPHDRQREVFVRQIHLAQSLALPIIVHIRQANQEALDIMAAEKAWQTGAVLHCFSGNRRDAFRALDLGFNLGVGGVLTFENSRLPELVTDLPLESILLETDCPFLAPHPHRGKRNHPALVELVYRRLAEVKGVDFAEIEATIDRNAERFFEFE